MGGIKIIYTYKNYIMDKYFVYAFLDPNNKGDFKYEDYEFEYEPFYVGKGCGRRIEKHFNCYIKNMDDNTYKYRKMRHILANGQTPIIKKIIENASEKEAFLIELKLIKIIGRYDEGLGPLTNHTNGGEGNSGRITSDDTKKKISESLKSCGRIYEPKTDEEKEHIRSIMTGRVSPMKNKHQSQDAKDKISKNNARSMTREVIQMNKEGIFIKEWSSMTSASVNLNINISGICNCCKYKKKHAGGYKWEYKNKK